VGNSYEQKARLAHRPAAHAVGGGAKRLKASKPARTSSATPSSSTTPPYPGMGGAENTKHISDWQLQRYSRSSESRALIVMLTRSGSRILRLGPAGRLRMRVAYVI